MNPRQPGKISGNYVKCNVIQVSGAEKAGRAQGSAREEEVVSGLMGECRGGAQSEGEA